MTIRLLQQVPVSGSVEEFHFDAVGDCIWVELTVGEIRKVAVFGKGVGGFKSEAVLFNSDQHAFVLASGQGYVFSTSSMELCYKTDIDYMSQVIAIPGRGLVLATDFRKLFFYDPTGLVWQSHDVAKDGLEFTGATTDLVKGRLWMQLEGDCSFSFDVNSLEFKFKADQLSLR
jgi:hypothetical protein